VARSSGRKQNVEGGLDVVRVRCCAIANSSMRLCKTDIRSAGAKNAAPHLSILVILDRRTRIY
jgi:hypothetical protein